MREALIRVNHAKVAICSATLVVQKFSANLVRGKLQIAVGHGSMIRYTPRNV
jgi:hypothetical protein